MSSTSVVIPYRELDGHRHQLLRFVQQWWAHLLPDAQIVMGSCEPTGPFNRSAAINDGVARSDGDTIIVADADVLVSPAGLGAALDQDQWSFPFDVYFTMGPGWTRSVMGIDPNPWRDIFSAEPHPVDYDHRHPGEVAAPCESGCVVMTRAMFDAAGGFDTRFVAWGFEDRAFAGVMTRLFGPPFRPHALAWHLWHSVADGHDPNSDATAANRNLYQQQKRAGFPCPETIGGDAK